jgi:hypothetical protein
VNWSAADIALVPPTVVTVMFTVPTASVGEVAVICVALFTVKPLAAVAPNITAVAPVNPVPVIVTPVPPAVGPLVGLTPVTVGAGLFTVNVWGDVVPPPGVGFVTVTLTGPVGVTWPAGIVIVSVSPPFETTPPASALLPKFTIEELLKFVPVRVMGTDWPTGPLVGLIPVSVGTGFATVKVIELDVPPPGTGLVTETG